jgi:hypothetical protein
VAEIPEGFGSEDEFVRPMTKLPPWAAGLPLVAKGWSRKRYAKPPKAAETTNEAQLPPLPTPLRGNGHVPAELAKTECSPEPAPGTPPSPSANGRDPVEPDDPRPELEGLDPTRPWRGIPLADIIGEPLIDGKICCPFHHDEEPSLHTSMPTVFIALAAARTATILIGSAMSKD